MTKLSVIVFVHIIWTVSAFLFNHQPNQEAHSTSNAVHTFGNIRFEFVFSQRLYWQGASNACRQKGGSLAKVPDSRTQTFIMNILQTYGFKDPAIWIGLNDRSVEGTWVWDDGQPLQGYTNWRSGETDHDFQHDGEDCVMIKVVDDGKWHDMLCGFLFTYTYICQFDNVTVNTNQPSTSATPPTTTATPPTTTVKPSQTSCPLIDCDHSCPNGFSGLYVDINGCIACTCI